MASSPCLEECCGDGSSNEGLQGHDDLFDDLLFSVYSIKNMIVSAGWMGMEVFYIHRMCGCSLEKGHVRK